MPTTYTAPGVYVEEVPSAVQPIAGVGTSTAGFVGVVPDKVVVPFQSLDRVSDEALTPIPDSDPKGYLLSAFPVVTDRDLFEVRVVDTSAIIETTELINSVVFSKSPLEGAVVKASYRVTATKELKSSEVVDSAVVVVNDYQADELLDTSAKTIQDGDENDYTVKEVLNLVGGKHKIVFETEPPQGATIKITYNVLIREKHLTPVQTSPQKFNLRYPVHEHTDNKYWYVDPDPAITLRNESNRSILKFTGTSTPVFEKIECDYYGPKTQIVNELIGKWNGTKRNFPLKHYPVTAGQTAKFKIGQVEYTPVLTNDPQERIAYVDFTGIPEPAPAVGSTIMGTYQVDCTFSPEEAKKPILCTSFTEFKQHFGGFSTDANQRQLAHAVQGFFHNGGTRCYVMRVAQEVHITDDLLQEAFGPIDEIAIVAAPGITSVHLAIANHCAKLQDRFAVLDCAETIEDSNHEFDPTNLQELGDNDVPAKSDYAAFYAPWIQVNDPASQILYPDQKEQWRIHVPPSGHVAGIYARVDAERGVHKAPANEAVRGALSLKYRISRAQQDKLNSIGVNCIRELNGSILVWGARTIGGDANGEWKYINVRRLFLFLRESIDEGTQWVVFEPNDPSLWAKITRNITAFLTNVWRAGAFFGNTPQEAFYVKCDAEINPPELRDLGQVVTEIGVAVTKPAEFVIFKISQWAGPSK